jgi:hypothetical protein
MSERQQLATAILLVVAIACPTMMDACSTVVVIPRCDQSWSDGEVVFLGKAVAQPGGETPLGNGFVQWTDFGFHFEPVEIFRGASKQAKDLIVYTGHGGGDCSEPFIVGVSYLVYARTIDGRLKAWGTPETMAGGTLRELRAIARGERADDLFGTVGIGSEYATMQDRIKSKPLVNVVVRAVGHQGARFSARTDEHGAYAFASLPSGKYRIEADSPSGLLPGEFPAYVKTGKGRGTGCRIDAFRSIANEDSVRDPIPGRGR